MNQLMRRTPLAAVITVSVVRSTGCSDSSVAQLALEKARQSRAESLVIPTENRLQLYERHQPFREEVSKAPPLK